MRDLFINSSRHLEVEDGQYPLNQGQNVGILNALLEPKIPTEFNPNIVQIDADQGCFFCGFYSPDEKFQKVFYVDGDTHNLKPENTQVICPTCFLANNLSYAAHNRLGFLSYLPEIKQVEINYIFRIVFAKLRHAKLMKAGEQKAQDLAIEVMSMFETRSTPALKMAFDHDFSDGVELARVLNEIDKEGQNPERKHIGHLSKLRWIPNERAFPEIQLDHYIAHGLLEMEGAK